VFIYLQGRGGLGIGMAALEWLAVEDLMSLDAAALADLHEEVLTGLKTGTLLRQPPTAVKEWISTWVREALKSNIRPEARYVALQVLVASLESCPVSHDRLLLWFDMVLTTLLSCWL